MDFDIQGYPFPSKLWRGIIDHIDIRYIGAKTLVHKAFTSVFPEI